MRPAARIPINPRRGSRAETRRRPAASARLRDRHGERAADRAVLVAIEGDRRRGAGDRDRDRGVRQRDRPQPEVGVPSAARVVPPVVATV